jgi:hypothetical protein
MKARRNHLIVKANLEQKESHEISMPDGSKISIYIGRKYGENNREINPSVCEVVSVGENVTEVSVGDTIIVHHNLIMNEASYIERDGQTVHMGIPAGELIYAKIKEGGELVPVFNNLIAERVVKPKVSELEFEQKTEQMKFKVISVPDGYTDVEPGQYILAYKLSDYEMVYHYKNRENRAIRIAANDILGVFN